MKKSTKSISIVFILLANMQLFAQHEKQIKNNEVEGLYLNALDFKQGKLTRLTDKQHKDDKIKLKQFFISPDIISNEQDKETVFYKDSIFSIRLTNGENYRFINRLPCLIADTSGLYIYTHKTTKTNYKRSGPYRRAVKVPVTYYYFSLGDHKAVYKLTLTNLRKYALTDSTIHFAVCSKFSSDEMLRKMNSQTGRFELNETILSALNK